MKVLAINGSPRMDEGNTAMILNPFLEGMKEAGADVEVFYTRKLHIEPCIGDMSCWYVNPGICCLDDDIKMLLPKFKEADVIVWASPVYCAGVTGPLKNLMDRQLPLHIQGKTGPKRQKIVLISTCGAWDLSMFDPLLQQMKTFYGRPNAGGDYVGALLRPMAEGLKDMIRAGETELIDDVLRAARDAGRQLAGEGRISRELQKKVRKELMTRDDYYIAAQRRMEK